MANIGKEDIFFYGGMDSDNMLETIAEGNYLKAINCFNADGGVGNKRGKVRKVKSNRKIVIPPELVPIIDEPHGATYEDFIMGSVKDDKNDKTYIFKLTKINYAKFFILIKIIFTNTILIKKR